MTTRTRSVFFLLAAVTVGALAQAVFAQAPAAAAAAAPAAAAAKDQSVTLWGMWVTGGWAMYPIGALSIANVVIAVLWFGYRSGWFDSARTQGPATTAPFQCPPALSLMDVMPLAAAMNVTRFGIITRNGISRCSRVCRCFRFLWCKS